VINRYPEERRPLLIGASETGRAAAFKIKTQQVWEVVMPSPKGSERARLQFETPVSEDANFHLLQEQATTIIREAKNRNPSDPDELLSTVIDRVARMYFRHLLKQRVR
jgi:hypothetical protein